MCPKQKKDGNNGKPTPIKVYEGETAEELMASMSGQVDEKYLKEILDIVKQDAQSQETEPDNPNTFTFSLVRGENSTCNSKDIIILKTATSTTIVPVLMNTSVNMDITLEVTPDANDNAQTAILVESDLQYSDGVIPMLVIPHTCEGNDNQAAITQIIEFLLGAYPERFFVQDIPHTQKVDVTAQLVVIQ